ncbi:MAG: ribonuclease III [Proteobacteria bacterium]|nr:ribonuclease III [Pseudomonadota bacterium]
MSPPDDIKTLTALLKHEFKDISLLEAALTHSSLTKGHRHAKADLDYERLEFLGDRVLGLVISEELYKRFDTAEAGQLSRRYNAQVRRESLAEIAEEMDLAQYIKMSDDLAAAGGKQNPAILEDIIEAVIAALYLDGGYQVARNFIKSRWWSRFDRVDAAKKDAKSALQEWAAKKGKGHPVYHVVEETGPDHDPRFVIEVTVDGLQGCKGEGSSKRMAEQAAAEKLLKGLQSE